MVMVAPEGMRAVNEEQVKLMTLGMVATLVQPAQAPAQAPAQGPAQAPAHGPAQGPASSDEDFKKMWSF